MNSVVLTGTICTKELKLRKTDDKLVTSFYIKVKKEYKKDFSGKQSDFNYIPIVCWSNMAEVAIDKYKYGMIVEVRGSIRTGKRELKDYVVLKNGKQIPFYMPVFEVYASRIDIICDDQRSNS